MACKLKIFSQYIDEVLQPGKFQDVCINGLQVTGKSEVRSIATSVTASLKSIRQAVHLGVDALIVHHGIFLKGKDVVVQAALKEKLLLLLAHDISLFAYHIPLDAHQELGNNWAAAKLLGWTDLEPFGMHHGEMVGVKGNCPPLAREELKKVLEKFYGSDARTVFAGPKKIKSCALLSGGAHKWIDEAVKAEVDCFITGTSDEPIWHIAAEEKINFMALGHAATEKIGVQLLGEHLSEQFQIHHTFIDDNNPF